MMVQTRKRRFLDDCKGFGALQWLLCTGCMHACTEPPLLSANTGLLGMARSRNALLDQDARKRALSVSQSLRVRWLRWSACFPGECAWVCSLQADMLVLRYFQIGILFYAAVQIVF